MGLLDTYELMKQAEQENLEAQTVNEEETKLAEERMDVLAKYAEFAENALKEEFGDDYSMEDVEKLAEMLVLNDIQAEEEQEKVAELVEAGQVMAHAFAEELQKIADQAEPENK